MLCHCIQVEPSETKKNVRKNEELGLFIYTFMAVIISVS
jgi:hypothetical protein